MGYRSSLSLAHRQRPVTIMPFTHAVIMGDLVSSESAQSVKRLHVQFNKAVEAANASRQRDIVSPLTITLGDEFQGLTRSLTAAFEIARTLRIMLLAENIACRFVIGLANIETPVNRRTAWNMMGPGLAAAREKLDHKQDPNAIRFSLPGEPVIEILLDAIGRSITEIQEGWTERQIELVVASEPDDQTAAAVAKKLRIALNTYYKIRRAGRLDLHENQWNALAVAVAELDKKAGLK